MTKHVTICNDKGVQKAHRYEHAVHAHQKNLPVISVTV